MPRRDLEPKFPCYYRKHPGMQAWVLHRVSGLLLVLYFVLHMFGSSGVCTFLPNITTNVYVQGVVVVLFAWHAMNGLRIIFLEFFKAAERQFFKPTLFVFTILAVIIILFALYYVNEARLAANESASLIFSIKGVA